MYLPKPIDSTDGEMSPPELLTAALGQVVAHGSVSNGERMRELVEAQIEARLANGCDADAC